jgi:hypothetical protein
MDEKEIILKAIEEIQTKTFGLTQQFLDIHEIEFRDPLIDRGMLRVDTEREDGIAVVYFPVKNEKINFTVYLEISPDVVVRSVDTVPYSSVYFKAISPDLDFRQLAALTVLPNSGGWTKGDKRGTGKVTYKNSCIRFEPNPEPDDFEDKLRKLILFLEQDVAGIATLTKMTAGYIQVAMEFHNGNTMLGGPHINRDLIRRMSLLNLEIDFDLYVGGNTLKPL